MDTFSSKYIEISLISSVNLASFIKSFKDGN